MNIPHSGNYIHGTTNVSISVLYTNTALSKWMLSQLAIDTQPGHRHLKAADSRQSFHIKTTPWSACAGKLGETHSIYGINMVHSIYGIYIYIWYIWYIW